MNIEALCGVVVVCVCVWACVCVGMCVSVIFCKCQVVILTLFLQAEF